MSATDHARLRELINGLMDEAAYLRDRTTPEAIKRDEAHRLAMNAAEALDLIESTTAVAA
jgi:fructosamine-3-kinase